MSILIYAIIVVLVLALVVWLVQAYLPVGAPFKNIIIVLLVLLAIFLILNRAGLI